MIKYPIKVGCCTMDLNVYINLSWAEGLEGMPVAYFNLVECPETQVSTPWDFPSVTKFAFLNEHSLCDWFKRGKK